jgi:hypothetical protein
MSWEDAELVKFGKGNERAELRKKGPSWGKRMKNGAELGEYRAELGKNKVGHTLKKG